MATANTETIVALLQTIFCFGFGQHLILSANLWENMFHTNTGILKSTHRLTDIIIHTSAFTFQTHAYKYWASLSKYVGGVYGTRDAQR